MKRLTPIELSGILVGIIFIVIGLHGVIWPQQMVIHHSVNGPREAYFQGRKDRSERVTESRARFYGITCVTLGVGIAAFSSYRPKK